MKIITSFDVWEAYHEGERFLVVSLSFRDGQIGDF
jgi:hypothetical protein